MMHNISRAITNINQAISLVETLSKLNNGDAEYHKMRELYNTLQSIKTQLAIIEGAINMLLQHIKQWKSAVGKIKPLLKVIKLELSQLPDFDNSDDSEEEFE